MIRVRHSAYPAMLLFDINDAAAERLTPEEALAFAARIVALADEAASEPLSE